MGSQFRSTNSLLAAARRHGATKAKPQAQWQIRRLTDAVSSESNRVQVYISRTLNPHINLAIEHRLLQASHPSSTVLFLYTNNPCVVIGRNQNPWLEVNLGLLNRGLPPPSERDPTSTKDEPQQSGRVGTRRVPVQLVRRYSGGGTVFHDEGNVNYSVICPAARFDRNRHAEMVVRALRSLVGGDGGGNGRLGIRVNERHDIVMSGDDDGPTTGSTFKISGSAYKITRTRALHHGTCLLSSPHLGSISDLLRSPAQPYIRARGTESVRSPVRNVAGIANGEFEDAVVDEFGAMYGPPSEGLTAIKVGVEELEDPHVLKIYDEITSPLWTYGQTPQFTFSTKPTVEDDRPRPALPEGVPSSLDLSLTVRKGKILEAELSGLASSGVDIKEFTKSQLVEKYLHQIRDWGELLSPLESRGTSVPVGSWLNSLFGLEAPVDLTKKI